MAARLTFHFRLFTRLRPTALWTGRQQVTELALPSGWVFAARYEVNSRS